MDKCLIQDEETDKIIKIIRNWMKKYSILPARKDNLFFSEGLIRNVMVRKGLKLMRLW